MPTTKRAPVTLRALWKRVTRALNKESPTLYLTRPRSERARREFGAFMLVDGNTIIDSGSLERLEHLARERSCLAEWEYLAS